MLSDEDLDRMLTGTDGVPALDAAREVRTLRAMCKEMREQCQAMQSAAVKSAETAELLMHEKAEACARLDSILESLASMIAGARGAGPVS